MDIEKPKRYAMADTLISARQHKIKNQQMTRDFINLNYRNEFNINRIFCIFELSESVESVMKKKTVSLPIHSFKQLASILNEENQINAKVITGSYKSFLINQLLHNTDYSIMLLTASEYIAEDFYTDLMVFRDEKDIAFFPPPRKTVKTEFDKSDEHIGWLIDGLNKFKFDRCPAITTLEALDHSVPLPENIHQSKITLKKGHDIDFESFTRKLLLKGFDRKDYVSEQGDISIRGGIVDLFPIGWNNPLRIEFWGDTVDSIREFDSTSQRSINQYDKIEFIADLFIEDEEKKYGSPFDYFPKKTLLIIDEPEKVNQDLLEHFADELGKLKTLTFNGLSEPRFYVKTEPQECTDGSIKTLCDDLQKYVYQDCDIIISADGKKNLQRLRELIESEAETRNAVELLFKNIIWSYKPFSRGFISQDDSLVCITEHEIFNRVRTRFKKRKKSEAITISELQSLNPGDFVVHNDKGIAAFSGFKTIDMNGSRQDCIRLTFADDDKVYVSMNHINKISKYSAGEGIVPKLTKLGTGEWIRKKARTKKKIKDIARDLIKLYAKRKMQDAYAYPEDTDWQKEFEASFIYEDTPDQARSTVDIKRDMETNSPMDRLICGDVGFGKTELAIRAAFKAANAGKQTAVLVPTTILAQQHYMSFKDRMARYPVSIEVISRFKTKKEQERILENVKAGKVDILIGTHRLLSKDIKFKDLGLLIIDEEHRFGVSAKEKLRQIRETIDTLTLTATPIPRTLNFSLMGARDLSVMETPPRNRLPIITEIINWKDEKIEEAVMREIQRGGQVFFVTDRVKDIEEIAAQLEVLFPTLVIGIVHGQMTGSQIEKVMEKFIKGQYDILIATKIIESGIDIPNANTMIINRANNFGLAELYQLRGRVGRTNKQAYCYLMVPKAKQMTRTAIQRLQAVEEFTDLGSGFKLAMRDMEIRGAGNLLGAEQSGFILDIGVELYQKVLDEAVTELKEQEFQDLFDEKGTVSFENEDLAIEIPDDALFPDKYMPKAPERYMYYRRLYNIRELKELEELKAELTDKYGRLPEETINLLLIIKMRIAGIATGMIRLSIRKNKLQCELPPKENEKYYQLAFPIILDYIQQLEDAQLVQKKDKLILELPLETKEGSVEAIWKLKRMMELCL